MRALGLPSSATACTRVPASESVPRPTRKPVADGEVTPDALKVLALTDGKRTVASLAALTALGEFEATKAVYKLIGPNTMRTNGTVEQIAAKYF